MASKTQTGVDTKKVRVAEKYRDLDEANKAKINAENRPENDCFVARSDHTEEKLVDKLAGHVDETVQDALGGTRPVRRIKTNLVPDTRSRRNSSTIEASSSRQHRERRNRKRLGGERRRKRERARDKGKTEKEVKEEESRRRKTRRLPRSR